MLFHHRNYKLVLLFAIIIIFTTCKGQIKSEKSATPKATHTIGKKVSELDKSIWSIHQDAKNHYWFGSNGNGVFYFDGNELTNFTSKDGLSSNQIRGIQEDKFGNLYFDTPRGVSKFDGQKITILEPIISPENEWKSAPSDLWFKGNGDINGVFRYDGESLFHLEFPEKDLNKTYGIALEESPYSSYGAYNIYKDKSGNIWFGTLLAGVFRFDGSSLFWIPEKELAILDDGRVPGVRSIIEDKEGNFWLSNILNRYQIIETKEGSVSYEKLEGIKDIEEEKEIFPYFMSAITDDENGDLWMLTYDQGIWKYDGEKLTQYLVKNGEKDALLFSIYKDKKGMIWVGTHNAGVYVWNESEFERYKIDIETTDE